MHSERVGLRPLPVAVFDTEYSVVTSDRPTGYPLEAEEFAEGIGGFMNRQLNIFPEASRTLLLSGEVLDGFGFPDENPNPDNPAEAPTEHPVLESIRAAGWRVKALTPYMRCFRKVGKHTVVFTVAVMDWLTLNNTPMLLQGAPLMTAARLNDWALATGVQWYGNGSFTGGDLFWHVHKEKRASIEEANKRRRPENKFPMPWFAEDIRPMLQEGMAGCESPYTKGQFINDALPEWPEQGDFEFLTVDARKAYLTAACSVKVATGKLLPGPTDFDKGLSGFWRVRIEPWTSKNLPDPAGYAAPLADGTRWVTSPTLELLDELGREFTIYESWVNKGTTFLKGWGERLRDVLYGPSGATLEKSVKRAAVQTIGDWARVPEDPEAKVRLCRPDWNAAVIALFRSNLYRKMAGAGNYEVYPAWIETDKVLYAPADEQMVRNAVTYSGRTCFPEGETFGHFRFKLEKRTWPKVANRAPEFDGRSQYESYMESTAVYDVEDDFDMEG